MRISDWSSDVCSSDLGGKLGLHLAGPVRTGEVIARPARPDQRFRQPAVGLVYVALEKGQRMLAAERFSFPHQQYRHVGPGTRPGDRGAASRQPPTRDQPPAPIPLVPKGPSLPKPAPSD